MAFINEIISVRDRNKYQITELNSRWGASPDSYWCIDRKKEVWLRLYDNNTPSYADYNPDVLPERKPQYWDFYWKGTLMLIATELIYFDSSNRSSIKKQMKLVGLDAPNHIEFYKRDLISVKIPNQLTTEKNDVIDDLKEALICNTTSSYDPNENLSNFSLLIKGE